MKHKVLFKVCDDALIVANTGNPFTREGVISICYSHLSAKEKDDSRPIDAYRCSDGELVSKIRATSAKIYKADPNWLLSGASGEDAVKGDYSGRVIWELLQNADDAANSAKGGDNASLIGKKGLGFKSVLEVTGEPEIRSGPFHFLFSKQRTEEFFEQEGLKLPKRLPIFSFPHQCDSHESLDPSYSTVIRLPFRDGNNEARAEILKQLDEISVQCLLLCQGLDCIEVDNGETVKTFEVECGEKPFKSSGCFDLTVNTEGQSSRWRCWSWIQEKSGGEKRLSAAVFLPLDGKKIIACETAPPLHVFFPTQEEIGAKALLHASFDVQQNRERFSKEQKNKCDLIEAIRLLVKEVLKDADTPLSSVSEVFGKVVADVKLGGDDAKKDLVWEIKESIVQAIEETEFVPVIGGKTVKPSDVKLWKHNLGSAVRENCDEIRRENLLVPEFSGGDHVQSMLKKLGATEITDEEHAKLLRYCRRDSIGDSLRALEVADSIMQKNSDEETNNLLRKVPLWWIDVAGGGCARAFNDNDNGKAILLEKPADWPAWLPADSLSIEFQKQVQVLAGKDEGNHAITEWPLRKEKQFRDEVLLSHLEKEKENDDFRQPARCAEVLRLVMRWSGDATNSKPFVIGNGGDRDKLGSLVRVPVNKGRWLPVVDCYLGKSWDVDGPASFYEYFKSVENRGLVLPLEEWPAEIKEQATPEKWEALLRFLGVSQGLKVLRFNLGEIPGEITDYVEQYKNQCLGEIRRFHSTAHSISGDSVFIEHFPSAIEKCSPSEIYQMVKLIMDNIGPSRSWIKYLYYGDRREKYSCTPFAVFQLKNIPWLPCKPALLFNSGNRAKPSDAYMPGCGLGGLLPEVKKVDDAEAWGAAIPILRNLGVQEQLPEDAAAFHQWMEGLAGLASKATDEDKRWTPNEKKKRGRVAEAAEVVFKTYKKKFPDQGVPLSTRAPFLRLDDKGEFLEFVPARDLFWADKPYFVESEVKTAVLRLQENGIKIFFLRLDEAKGFGFARLSDKLGLQPAFSGINREEGESLLKTYKERRDILNVVATSSLPENLDIRAREEMRLCSTKYSGINPAVEYWHDEDENALDVSIASDTRKWMALASGLATITGKKNKDFRFTSLAFADLLRAESRAECIDILRKDHNSTEEVLRELPDDRLESDGNSALHDSQDLSGPNHPDSASPTAAAPPDSRGVNKSVAPDSRGDSPEVSLSQKRPSSLSSGTQSSHEADDRAERRSSRTETSQILTDKRVEAGERAEKWLLSVLHMPSVLTVERETYKFGSDCKITFKDGDHVVGHALVEIKHIEGKSGSIFWSRSQIQKARECQKNNENYFIAIARGSGEDGYEVFWFWNPLEDFTQKNLTSFGLVEISNISPGSWEEVINLTFDSVRTNKITLDKVRIEIDTSDLQHGGTLERACDCLKEELRKRSQA